jgi:hypothetical protein
VNRRGPAVCPIRGRLSYHTRHGAHVVEAGRTVRIQVPAIARPAYAGGMVRRFTWLTTYAVAMAYLESAVVVYLRALYYPHGFGFPLVLLPSEMAAIEVGREAATIVMLLGVAALASDDRWDLFLAFCYSFGVWDIFYYVWLWVFVRWPPSLLTWDILFLIPVPWVGPVLAPVLVSAALVTSSLALSGLKRRGVRLRFAAPVWTAAAMGGALVLGSFMIDFLAVVRGGSPPPFRWGLFTAGVAMAAAALLVGIARLERRSIGTIDIRPAESTR